MRPEPVKREWAVVTGNEENPIIISMVYTVDKKRVNLIRRLDIEDAEKLSERLALVAYEARHEFNVPVTGGVSA